MKWTSEVPNMMPDTFWLCRGPDGVVHAAKVRLGYAGSPHDPKRFMVIRVNTTEGVDFAPCNARGYEWAGPFPQPEEE